MNVLLATCSIEEGAREKAVQLNSHYPIGLASLHAYLESQGHNVHTLFLNDFPESICLDVIQRDLPGCDVLGLQILSHNRTCSYKAIERFSGQVRVIVGGIHASVMHEQIVRKYPGVIVVIGEGELTLAELLSGKPPNEVDGVAFVKNGEFVRTPDRVLIEDLDALPFPKHEAFWNDRRTVASVMTSRGCPFKCSFCALDTLSRRRVRFRSVENVVGELLHLKRTYPRITGVWIHDDSFFLDNERAIALCDRIERENLGLRFICSGRFKPLSERLVRAMERARFTWVLFGLESGCQRVLDRNHKALKLFDATKALQLLSDSPIQCTSFLIVGLPGEDEDSVADTCDFVNHLQRIKPMHYDDIGVAMVYPNTELYSLMKQAGKITDDYWMTDGPVPFYTVEHDIDTLNGYKGKILSRIRTA